MQKKSDQTEKRSESLRVRLSPEMMKRFQVIAADFGMAPSTLAAFAIVSFVRTHEPGEHDAMPRRVRAIHEVEEVLREETDW